MIENSFHEIMAENQLLSLPSFILLLDSQYEVSSTGPGGYPARWALVNAIIAMALRFKTAPGSEGDLSPIAHASYQNATAVIPQLILQDPSFLSIEALLAMAMSAQGTPDNQAFIVLVINASRLRELLRMSSESSLAELGVVGQYERICEIAHAFDEKASLALPSPFDAVAA